MKASPLEKNEFPASGVRSPVIFDVHQMQIDSHGVKDFFWPMSYEERNAFCMNMVNAYVALIHKYVGDTTNSYGIFFKYFANECVSIFWADAIAQRCKQAGREPVLSALSKVWAAAYEGREPPMPYLEKFRNRAQKTPAQKFGLARIKRLFSRIKWGAGGAMIDGMYVKRITPQVLEKEIIATQRLPLIVKHFTEEKQKVVFCRADRWFGPITDEEQTLEVSNAAQGFETSLLNYVAELYAASGTNFPDTSRRHLAKLLREGTASLRIHEKRLMDPAIAVPRHIWTGSTGGLWDTLLRLEVMRRGGKAVGHDHGAGQAHVDNPFTGIMELWGMDEYVTFNHDQAHELTKHMPNWPNPARARPLIIGFQTPQTPPEPVTVYDRYRAKDFKVKTIYFLAVQYDGDRGRIGPSSPDIIHVDWQARLVSHLQKWGYNVVFKIHPETHVLPPAYFENIGVKTKTEPLENIINEADLLLFDCVYTSVLHSTLKTNIPMVMMDFYNHPWTPKAVELFTKRSPLLFGSLDGENKRRNDWEELRQAILDAPERANNNEFFNYYYA